jgi:hypothetical protein
MYVAIHLPDRSLAITDVTIDRSSSGDFASQVSHAKTRRKSH